MAGHLLADKGHDRDENVTTDQFEGMAGVISLKKRKIQGDDDKKLSKLRHLVKIAFLNLKARRLVMQKTPDLLWMVYKDEALADRSIF